MGLWNALIETLRSNLHQQLCFPVLVRQFKVMSHNSFHDKGPIQVIGSCYCSSRHQVFFFTTNLYRLRNIVVFCISIEWAGIRIEESLWVGTHVYSPVEARLKEFYVEAKLILISPASGII